VFTRKLECVDGQRATGRTIRHFAVCGAFVRYRTGNGLTPLLPRKFKFLFPGSDDDADRIGSIVHQ